MDHDKDERKAGYVLKIMRHRVARNVEAYSLEDAVRQAWAGLEDGYFYPEQVVDLDGAVVIDHDELFERINTLDKQI